MSKSVDCSVLLMCTMILVNPCEPADAALRYRLTMLPPVQDTDLVQVVSINASGQIAGRITGSIGGVVQSVVWNDPQGRPMLITGFGDDFCLATALNDAGVVVGTTGEGVAAFSWMDGHDLEVLPGTTVCCGSGEAINNFNVITGQVSNQGGANLPVMWVNGEVLTLPMLEGTITGTAYDISDSNIMVGDNDGIPVLWHNGKVIDLEISSTPGLALGVNYLGEVVGWFLPPSPSVTKPFHWRNGTQVDLPLLPGGSYGMAYSITDNGLIVGTSQLGFNGPARAVVWQNGQVIDLNVRTLNVPPEIVLVDAADINAAGQIACNAFVNGQERGARLDPVPPADVIADGSVNIDDLVAVITAWGPCPAAPAICAADVNDDGMVNIDDLVRVILSWG